MDALTRRLSGNGQADELERLLPWGRPPRLVLRFALYTGLGIALAAGAILLFVLHFERSRAERAATMHTRLVAEIVADELEPGDVRVPSRSRLRELDRIVARRVLGDGVVRVDLIGAKGTIAYSSDHSLIGQRDPDLDRIGQAIAGTTVSNVTSIDLPGARNTIDVLRAFSAVRVPGAPVGVLALSQDHAPIVAAAHRAVLPVVAVLELVLLGLYVSLFPILRRVTRGLHRQMDVIEHQALHDGLTGLPNRTLFEAKIEELVASGEEAAFAVLIVELDRFKDINDTLGRNHGDTLLAEIAARIGHAAAECDAVARLDGDDFAVISRRAGDPRSALLLAERLAAAIAEPIEVGGVSLDLQTSIGIALCPEHAHDSDGLLRRADVAMRAAKSVHTPQLYSTERDTHSPERLALASELRSGLDAGELVVYYQPQIDLQTGTVSGVEALVRWRHPRRGFLTPDEFLTTAENAGLMRRLTQAVLEQALAQGLVWRNAGMELSIAVNVSGQDIVDTRFVDEVGQRLAEHGTDPALLHLEITEGTLLQDRSRAESVLTRLSELGARIAVDDFGTGYSSLGHLKRLPVDILKIDKSFVISMATEPGDAAIVRSTIDLAHSLGLSVVAEGVETDEARRQLAALGCDVGQGFGISRPLPAHDLDGWLAANGHRVGGAVPLRPVPQDRDTAAPRLIASGGQQ